MIKDQNMNSTLYDVTILEARQNVLLRHVQQMALHVGEYKWSCRTEDYHGWLKCDGRVLSCADYPYLYEIIGTTYGSDGIDEGSFKLPNFQGRVMAATSSNHSAGTIRGVETVTLTVSQIPGHTHTGYTGCNGTHTHDITDPTHTHTQTTINDDFNGSSGEPPGFSTDSTGNKIWNNISASTTGITINDGGAHTHYFNTNSTGGGLAHENMQPTIFAGNMFIFSGFVYC